MARVSLHLDSRYAKNKSAFPLCIKVSHRGDTRFIKIGLELEANQWDKTKLEIKGVSNSKRASAKALNQLSKAKSYLAHNTLDVKTMSLNELKRMIEIEILKSSSTSSKVLEKAAASISNDGFLKSWSEVLIQRTLDAKRKGTADWYRAGVNAFITFNKGRDIQLIDIDESKLEDFKAYGYKEIKNGKEEIVKPSWKPNTIAGYLEVIRSIMNKAIREKKEFITANHQPFKNVVVPRETVEVDSITKADIQAMRILDLEEGSKIWLARARFLFMFNCQGINFTDLAQLKVSDRVGNTISYYRAKTSRRKKRKKITVTLTKEADKIWQYFAKNKTTDDYAFDILHDHEYSPALMKYNQRRKSSNTAVTEKNRIKCRMKKQNKELEKISEAIECRIKITTYDARYGWVNAALDSGISEELIGKGLGHSNLQVTRVYFEERHKRTDLGDLNELITQ
jgi:integrase